MTVTSSHKDLEALTLTIVAEFDAPVEPVWRVWEDPRKLERWWGPPTFPATFDEHELTVGSRSRYHMTGPEGQKAHGWWRITAVEPQRRIEFEDGFADENDVPATEMPTIHVVVTIEQAGSATRMTTVSRFASAEQLEQLASMGMEEGMKEAMGQLDGIVAEDA